MASDFSEGKALAHSRRHPKSKIWNENARRKKVQDFIVRHPDAIIVNLGAGLCTRFYRLNHDSINWINIDFLTVKSLWENLIGTSARSQYLGHSILDFAWIDKIKAMKSSKVLFIAEGVLMFLKESEVKQLINKIQLNFPSSEMIFDSLGVFLAEKSNLNSGSLGIETSYQWGIENLKEIETWNDKVTLIDRCYYLDRHKTRLGWLGLFSCLPIVRKQVKIGHLRFG